MTTILDENTIYTGSDEGEAIIVRANNVEVRGGDGDDWISTVLSGTVSDLENIYSGLNAGEGSNQVFVSIVQTGVPSSSPLPISVGAGATGGEGDDVVWLDFQAPYADQGMFVLTDAGDDRIKITSSVPETIGDGAHSAQAEVLAGEGDDRIDVDMSTIGTENFTGNSPVLSTRLSGNWGNDTINSRLVASIGDAENSIWGGTESDLIRVEAVASSGSAENTIYGDEGNDRLTLIAEGSSATNIAYGGDGEDRVSATIRGEGRSELYGGEGNDRLKVSGGDENFLTGNQGNDTLLGSTGADRMIGGQGDDYLKGYAGDDTFEFQSARNGERDRIDGFVIGDDVIDVSRIDANVWRGGNQSFSFDESGNGGTGKIWVEDYGTRSIVHADTGRVVLDIVLLDGRGVHADDYGASDFIL